MSILWFLLIGLIAGWIAGQLVEGDGFGLIGNIVVGIIGALIGGSIFSAFGVTAYGTIGNIVMAVVGAVVLLFGLRMLFGSRHARLR